MKIGQLKFEHNGHNGQVKVAKHWGSSDHEEWQQYLSRAEWDAIVKELAIVKVDEPQVDEAVKDVEVFQVKKGRK